MSGPLKFSPRDHERMLRMAAELVAEKVLEQVGEPSALVLLPVPTVASMSNMSRPTVAKHMPTIRISQQSAAVRLSDYQTFIDSRRKVPAGKEAVFNSPVVDDGEQVPPLSVVGDSQPQAHTP